MRLVTRKEFSELAGISDSATSKACKNSLAPALQGKRVDMDHPAAVQYMENRNSRRRGIPKKIDEIKNKTKPSRPKIKAEIVQKVKPVKKSKKVKKIVTEKLPEPEPKPIKEMIAYYDGETKHEIEKDRVPANIRDFLDKPFGEIVDIFGTDIRFIDWLKATEKIEAIHDKRIKAAKENGKLVNLAIVKGPYYDNIRITFEKILADGCKTMALRIKALALAEEPDDRLVSLARDTIGSYVKAMQARIDRALSEWKV